MILGVKEEKGTLTIVKQVLCKILINIRERTNNHPSKGGTQNKRTNASRAVRATKAKNQPEERENVFNEKACSAWCRPCVVAKEKRKPGGPTFQSLI